MRLELLPFFQKPWSVEGPTYEAVGTDDHRTADNCRNESTQDCQKTVEDGFGDHASSSTAIGVLTFAILCLDSKRLFAIELTITQRIGFATLFASGRIYKEYDTNHQRGCSQIGSASTSELVRG